MTERKLSLSLSQIFHVGSSPCKPWHHLMARNKWRWWQLGTGIAASPQCPLQGTSHVAAPVPGTVAVPDSPSVQSSRSRESSLGGKLITEHTTFPSLSESCRWESCAEHGDFSSFRARVTVFCSILFSLVHMGFHVSQLGSSSKT